MDFSDKNFWESAINRRRSCRSFEARPVESETMEKLKAFTQQMELPFAHETEFRFFQSDGKPLANNLRNPPPDCVAFLSQTDLLTIAKTGFAGELFILYATGLGLSTCWYGHYKLNELERLMPHLGEHKHDPMPSFGYGKGEVEGRRAICITPLGYWKQSGARPLDRLTMNMMSFKRKPLAELMEDGCSAEALPKEIAFAFDLARKAPSGANKQEWRFGVSEDHKTATIAKPIGYKHPMWEHDDVDVAICASHFWVGLQIQGIVCEVNPFVDQNRVVWRFSLE